MERDEAIRQAGQLIAEALALLLPPAPKPAPSPPTGWVVGDSDALYLNTSEVSARLGIAASSIRSWRSTGTGPPAVKFGARVMYPLDELEAWEQKQRSAEASDQRRRGSGFIYNRTNRAQKL